MPGMLRRLPWWLLDPEGPLVVRWSNLPASLLWLLRWIRAGRIERVEQHPRALRAPHAPSSGRYQRPLGPRAAGLIEMTGQIYVWQSNAPNATEALARLITQGLGVENPALQAKELRALSENLAPL